MKHLLTLPDSLVWSCGPRPLCLALSVGHPVLWLLGYWNPQLCVIFTAAHSDCHTGHSTVKVQTAVCGIL